MNDALECELVERARAGDARSLELLTVEVQRRVCAYANRVLLDPHKAEDLAQDTVTAVLGALGNFRQVDRFWPWVFTIASNNVRQHFRRQRLRKVVPMSNLDESLLQSSADTEGGEELARQELAELTRQGMSKVGQRHRMVLALRFYEDMPHAEIARALGCSEMGARVLFYRAKLALLRELKRLGVSKTMLTAALAAFGSLTLGRSAQGMTVSVSSAAASEGVLTGFLSAKIKVAVAAVLMGGALTAWPLLETNSSGKSTGIRNINSNPIPRYGPPLYAHSITRGRNIARQSGDHLSEWWLYFPQGVGGPILSFDEPMETASYSGNDWDLIAPDGIYNFNGTKRVVELRNTKTFCRVLHTQCLPTDSHEFCTFIDAMEGEDSHAYINKSGYSIDRDPLTAYVTGGEDFRPKGRDPFLFKVTYESPAGFDPFTFKLPAGWELVDTRDTIHKQGWAFFRISGELRGQKVSGTGQVPFVYNASLSHPMWVRISVGDQLILQDDGGQAVVRDVNGAIRSVYPGGTFFRGFTRTWEGFHTMDSIRRDAAADKIPYKSDFVQGNNALVRITLEKGEVEENKWWVRYIVDVQKDLLNQMHYWQGPSEADTSQLTFTYLEGIAENDPEFTVPERVDIPPSMRALTGDLFWLIEATQVINGVAGG